MSHRLHVDYGDHVRALDVPGAESALPLAELLARHQLPLNVRCGGRGVCHGCEIELRAGKLRPHDGAEVAAPVRVKACQHQLASADVAIAVPARSRLSHAAAVVSSFRLGVSWARAPLTSARYGAAVDVGTTTVVLVLCDLVTGAIVAEASAFNAQIQLGEDVVTRIHLCLREPGAVQRLQRAIAQDTIQKLLEQAVSRAGIDRRKIGAMTVAGNTTMQHLLAGENPAGLGVYPFKPVFLAARDYAPAALGLDFGDDATRVHLLPGPAAYVGADLAAGMVATGLIYAEQPVLLVDIGTNGEIVARAAGRTLGCATAAGPAFEGAGLSSGTRAVAGAIERVRFDAATGNWTTMMIGEAPHPVGLCGSAYIDLLWEGRRAGLLETTGRFSPAFVSAAAQRFERDEFGQRLRLPCGDASGTLSFSEGDVARLLQAKAAIAAGIETMLSLLRVDVREVETVYLAGGFGLHLSLEHAIGCGLLPGFRPEQIQMVGNTSLGGAFLALHDSGLFDAMTRACAMVETVELNLQPGFEDAYIEHLALP